MLLANHFLSAYTVMALKIVWCPYRARGFGLKETGCDSGTRLQRCKGEDPSPYTLDPTCFSGLGGSGISSHKPV